MLVPYVIQKSGTSERLVDIFSRLLDDRIIMLTTEINDDVATLIISQLLYLESENPTTPINLYINSPGGGVDAALAIYDTIQYISAPVHTMVIGMAASAATVLTMCGSKGNRKILPHARMMVHQIMGGARGQFEDIEIQFKQMQERYELLLELYTKHTNHNDINVLKKMLSRDYFLTAEESVAFGLVDKIVIKHHPVNPSNKK